LNKKYQDNPSTFNIKINLDEKDIYSFDQLDMSECDKLKLENFNNKNNNFEINLQNNEKNFTDDLKPNNQLLFQTIKEPNSNKVKIMLEKKINSKIKVGNNIHSKEEEEIFSPKLILSSFCKTSKDFIEREDNEDIFENRNFDINYLINSSEISHEKLVLELKD